jgi:hypothetical protein
MAGSGIIVSVAHNIINKPASQTRSNNYALVLVAICLLTGLICVSLLLKKVTAPNLIIGGLCCWAILLLLASIFFPGGSYIFAWPLLSGLLASFPVLFDGKTRETTMTQMALLSIAAVFGVALLIPVVYTLLVGLRFEWPGVAMMAVLLLTFLGPHLQTVSGLTGGLMRQPA